MPRKGESWSKEAREQMSARQKVYWAQPERKQELQERAQMLWKDPEHRAKISASMKRRMAEPEMREKYSKAQLERRRREIEEIENAPPITEKVCAKCGQRKPVEAYYTAKKKLKSGFVKVSPHGPCKECHKEAVALRYERQKEEGIALERKKRYRENEDREHRRVKQREWETAKRRAEGIPPRNFKRQGQANNAGLHLSCVPLREFLSEAVERYGKAGIERMTGVPQKRVWACITGAQETLALSTIDRLCTGLGHPELLGELYPVEEKPIFGYFKP